jgi:hypothetical protein
VDELLTIYLFSYNPAIEGLPTFTEVRRNSQRSVFNGGADGGAEMAKRQLHKLSARKAETIAKPGRHADGGGLYLAIEAGAHGRRQWVFLYRVRGSSMRRELGLGSAKGKGKDGLSLADARLKAADTRKKLAEGKDPVAERRAKKAAAITFGEFADALLQSIKSGFKSKKTYADWSRDLKVRCWPIRSKKLQEIQTTDILAILSPMWLTTIARHARREAASSEYLWRRGPKDCVPVKIPRYGVAI